MCALLRNVLLAHQLAMAPTLAGTRKCAVWMMLVLSTVRHMHAQQHDRNSHNCAVARFIKHTLTLKEGLKLMTCVDAGWPIDR